MFFSRNVSFLVLKEEDMVVVFWKIWDGIFVDLFVLRGGSVVIAKRMLILCCFFV